MQDKESLHPVHTNPHDPIEQTSLSFEHMSASHGTSLHARRVVSAALVFSVGSLSLLTSMPTHAAAVQDAVSSPLTIGAMVSGSLQQVAEHMLPMIHSTAMMASARPSDETMQPVTTTSTRTSEPVQSSPATTASDSTTSSDASTPSSAAVSSRQGGLSSQETPSSPTYSSSAVTNSPVVLTSDQTTTPASTAAAPTGGLHKQSNTSAIYYPDSKISPQRTSLYLNLAKAALVVGGIFIVLGFIVYAIKLIMNRVFHRPLGA